MPRINHPTIGDIQKHAYLKGTILAVYGSSEEDPEYWDTVDINIALGSSDISGVHIPLFYHCTHDAVLRDNGALEGASAAFSEDDEVIVQCEIISAEHYKPLRIMGFMDKPKSCCKWFEDWQGETITFNHPWSRLDAASCSNGVQCSGTPSEVSVITFQENKVLKAELCKETWGWGCVYPWVDFDDSGEERINLSELSGFKAQIYIDMLSPSSQPDYSNCPSPANRYYYEYRIWIRLYVRNISLNTWRHHNYGWHSLRICEGDDTYEEGKSGLSYSVLQSKLNAWHDIELITDFNSELSIFYYSSPTPPLWGNNDYEIGGLECHCYVKNSRAFYYNDLWYYTYPTTSMKTYFDNLCLY